MCTYKLIDSGDTSWTGMSHAVEASRTRFGRAAAEGRGREGPIWRPPSASTSWEALPLITQMVHRAGMIHTRWPGGGLA